jgi:hypothetical protein
MRSKFSANLVRGRAAKSGLFLHQPCPTSPWARTLMNELVDLATKTFDLAARSRAPCHPRVRDRRENGAGPSRDRCDSDVVRRSVRCERDRSVREEACEAGTTGGHHVASMVSEPFRHIQCDDKHKCRDRRSAEPSRNLGDCPLSSGPAETKEQWMPSPWSAPRAAPLTKAGG